MKLKGVLFEAFWASVIGSVLALGGLFLNMPVSSIVLPLFVIILISVRHGFVFAMRIVLVISVMVLLGSYLKTGQWDPLVYLTHFTLLNTGVIIGVFSKNIHRNLNNKKIKVVVTNVVAAQLLSASIIAVMRLVSDNVPSSMLDILFYAISSICFVLIIAFVKPKWILTTRSRYLSSKERSRLLND
ncbi:hypothetical protein KG089_06555 [Carnobacteriaceae bacterium zg-ZUI252]|nr:hypothetical protein [Carnobacteriaceae bacterium zg-ZUI252]